MMELFTGLGLLLMVLLVFSLFSLKMPKGQLAMSGMADAAIASFLVEAIHKYILGNALSLPFFLEVGNNAGSLGGVAAAILVPINMGVNPVLAVSAGLAVGSFGILPGFIAGYVVAFLAPFIERKLPEGVNIIAGALVSAPVAYLIASLVNPVVTSVLEQIGGAITVAAEQQPIIMGFLLGGIMKIVCTSPLSSMALTAMLGLAGLPMGIAAIACVGGAISNGVVFKRMGYGDNSNAVAVILEPLTQAVIVTSHPLPVYSGSFLGGGLSGIVAAALGIINNAPGTASTIPGLLAPFAFNDPLKVGLAIALSLVAGLIGGVVVSAIFRRLPSADGAAHKSKDLLHVNVPELHLPLHECDESEA